MSLAEFIIAQTQTQIHAVDQENSPAKTYKIWKTSWLVDFNKEFSIGNNLQQQLEYLKLVIVQFASICKILIIIHVLRVRKAGSLLI